MPHHLWPGNIAEIKGGRGSVTKREIGFLLIGLGSGLMFASAAIVEVLQSLYRSAFITSYSWDKVLLIVPVLLLVIGGVLVLYRPRSERTSN
jgi:asparagine N-glycosylation enzyme membrane subunit Stt3